MDGQSHDSLTTKQTPEISSSETSWLAQHDNEAPATGIKVSVVGGGFVGLVTAAGLTQFGHSVTCVEKDPQKHEDLAFGKVSLFERDLPELVKANIERKRLGFARDLREAVTGQDFIVIAVGTPTGRDGHSDMGAFDAVIDTLVETVEDGQIVVIKSTVPVGTARRAEERLNAGSGGNGRSSSKRISVISCPEFLRESTAVYDFFQPERIVVGGSNPVAVDRVVQLFRVGMARPVPIVATDNESAELIKYASNAYLATRLAFVNELAAVCDALTIDVGDVTYALGLDGRIGPEYFDVGPGFGGSCLPKDLEAFNTMAGELCLRLSLVPAVEESNRLQFERVIAKVRDAVGSDLEGKRVGALGLSFKAQTNDMRRSPAVEVIQKLINSGAEVRAHDPVAMSEAPHYLPDVELCEHAEDVADHADVVLILTEWPDFQVLDWAGLLLRMNTPNLVDARNLLSPVTMRRYGFNYYGLGQH